MNSEVALTLSEQVEKLIAAVKPIPWPCAYCQHQNETPTVLWNTVKYALICQNCNYQQNYPDYIKSIDPTPRRV